MSDKKRVLIVDDSAVMREMIGNTLKEKGYEVVGIAKDGSEALEKYRDLRPDLVTMDIVMPKEHGIDAVKKIIAEDENARVVVISGLYQKSLVMEALEAGARDFLIKPFEPTELADTMSRAAS